MLTTKGRVLYTYLINNASKEQLKGITLFLALITGIQFSNFEKAMNSTSIGELRTVFWSEVIGDGGRVFERRNCENEKEILIKIKSPDGLKIA